MPLPKTNYEAARNFSSYKKNKLTILEKRPNYIFVNIIVNTIK